MKIAFFLSLAFLLLFGCSDRGGPVSPGSGAGDMGGEEGDGGGATVSFATDVRPIFEATCGGGSCHGTAGAAGNLVLAGADPYSDLINVTSFGYDPAVRVVPGDPEASVLYLKLVGTIPFVPAMPLGGSIDPALTEKIRLWIDEGALDN